jgi:hypothetical protein
VIDRDPIDRKEEVPGRSTERRRRRVKLEGGSKKIEMQINAEGFERKVPDGLAQ